MSKHRNAKLPSDYRSIHADAILRVVNRLLSPKGLKVIRVPRGGPRRWIGNQATHLTLIKKPRRKR